MSTEFNEKFFTTLVFASVILSIIIISVDEFTTTIKAPVGPISWLRVPFGIYLGLFPVGFLALAFLFPKEEMHTIERFGLSLAVSISINVVSILLANIFLGFPITLTRNLIIILFWSIAFYLLFLFRASFVPLAMDFWEQYDWGLPEKQKRFAWLKLFDLVLFISLFASLIIVTSIITRPGQPFNEVSQSIAPIAFWFLALFPSGYFIMYAFFRRAERSGLANLLLSILLSMPVHLASAIVLFIISLTTRVGFSFPKLLLVSMIINFLLYVFIFTSERIMPIIYYWLDRGQRQW